MEIATDVGGMATYDGACCIIEVMGRSAGWIAAGSALAKRTPDAAPHIVLLPEIPLEEESFLNRVREVVEKLKYCVVVVGEGLKNKAGEAIAADKSRLDAFGHPVLSGAAEHLAEIVSNKLKFKSRSVKLGYAQRAAAHFASATDVLEASACGEEAVKAAVDGQSGFMVKIIRVQNSPYKWSLGLHPLGDIANVEHVVPREWMTDDGFLPNEKFIEYARPLIEGEVKFPIEGGLPKYVTLEKVRIEKKLPAYE
jgi:6-phosphofructokinase 1